MFNSITSEYSAYKGKSMAVACNQIISREKELKLTNKVTSTKVMIISVHGDPLAQYGSIQSGGQNVYVKELALTLDNMGINVDVFTHWSDSNAPQIEPLGLNSKVIRLSAGYKGFLSKHKMFRLLPRFIMEIEKYAGNLKVYSVIHSNYWLSGWVGMQLQKKWKIPRVHTSHSLGFVRKTGLGKDTKNEQTELRLHTEKQLLLRADKVIATTPFEKDILIKAYSVLPEDIVVIPCGVNTEVFTPLKNKIRIKNDLKGKKIILFVGRFEENKGLEVLLEALVKLKNDNSDKTQASHLIIAGGDPLALPEQDISPEKKRYLDYINRNGISDLVTFVGPLDHKELRKYFSSADVTVVPSYYESFGLVAIEAMTCGCPVIASRTGGLQHIVRNGKTGLLVEPKDSGSLAEAISNLLTNQNKRTYMAKEAAVYARQYSWKRIAKLTLDIYGEVGSNQWENPYRLASPDIF